MKNLIERIKYGKIIDSYNLGTYHVAGPVDGTKRAIGAKHDLSGLVDSNFIEKDGQIFDSRFEKKNDYIELVRRFGQAYFDGRFDFKGQVVPIDSDYFILPIDKDKMNNLILAVRNLRDIEFSGELKHPIYRETLEDLCIYLMGLKTFGKEKATTKFEISQKQSTLERAEQYLKDLMFWRLDFHDYSDLVSINLTERQKHYNDGLKRNFIINRNWSKANQGSLGWRVVGEDEEKIIISGYQNKEKK